MSYPGRLEGEFINGIPGPRDAAHRVERRDYDAAVHADRVRERWGREQTALCAWLMLGDHTSAGVVAAAGFDAVAIDLQHGAATLGRLGEIVAAIEPTGAVPFVRVAWNDPAELMRVLDLGARGVICPMIGSPQEAETFVAACRYPPAGMRSYGPVRAAFGTGTDQTTRANETIVTFAMIETADGLEEVDSIAATPGLDGVFVGPGDLSLALGLSSFADLTDPRMLEALDTVLGAAERHGIVAGVFAPDPDRAVEMAARGFRFVAPVVDADLLRQAAVGALVRVQERDPGAEQTEPTSG